MPKANMNARGHNAKPGSMMAIVDYKVEAGVAWVTINRPEARNALNVAVRDGLWSSILRFRDDPAALVLVITGVGEAFCAGGDLKEMAVDGLGVPPRDYMPHVGWNVMIDKPCITAVNGPALGGGFSLVLMSDLCIASSTATFGITEARWGRGAPWAAPLAWVVGPRLALEMLMTGKPLSAKRAFEIGLVNLVTEPSELIKCAEELARDIVRNAPLSVRAGKQMVYSAYGMGWAEAIDRGQRLFEPAYRSSDAAEGPRAFLEHRPPRWQRR